jgi:hypothetical protein
MKIRIEANWDEEVQVWVAVAEGDVGLVTEAPTIDALQEKISVMLPDLLGLSPGAKVEVELAAISHKTLTAA